MADTEKYEFAEIPTSVTGWNAIITSNNEKIDSYLHTYLQCTLGEDISAYEAGYFHTDEKYYLALANISRQPALCLFIEDGNTDQEIRGQRIGPITNAGWAWTAGKPVYLSAVTPGALTQTSPASNVRQALGLALSATSILLNIDIRESLYGTTTTTSSTTSSTSSSTSSTASTTSSTASTSSSTTTTT